MATHCGWARLTRPHPRKEGSKARLRTPLLALCLMALIAYLWFQYARAEADLAAARARAARAGRELREQQARFERLRARVSELETDAYIERLARERLGLTKPGEVRYAVPRR